MDCKANTKIRVHIKSPKERSYQDQLMDLFIRPPRDNYNKKLLGYETFFYRNIMIHRDDFHVKNKRNLEIQGAIYTAVKMKDVERSCVIYLHGNSSSRLEGHAYAGVLCDEGFSLVSFDFAGSGYSEGDYVTLGWYEKDDVKAVIDFLRKNYPKITNIGLWGRSMGAVTALMTASEMKELRVIIADSPFSSLKQVCLDIGEKQYKLPSLAIRFAFYMLRKKVRKMANYDPKLLNTVKYVQNLDKDCSVLFLRADEDKMIYQTHVDDLFKVCRGEKYLTVFKGDHNSERPIELQESIIRFFIRRMRLNKDPITIKKMSDIVKNSSLPYSGQNQNQIGINKINLNIVSEYGADEKIEKMIEYQSQLISSRLSIGSVGSDDNKANSPRDFQFVVVKEHESSTQINMITENITKKQIEQQFSKETDQISPFLTENDDKSIINFQGTEDTSNLVLPIFLNENRQQKFF